MIETFADVYTEQERAGQFSISINDQYRICFHFVDGHAFDVQVIDYH